MAQCARARPTALLETYGKLSPPPPPTGADGKPPLHASLLPVAVRGGGCGLLQLQGSCMAGPPGRRRSARQGLRHLT